MSLIEPYTADDRGDRVDFYEVCSGDRVATLNREATVGGLLDQCSWDGNPNVKEWAATHGFPEVLEAADG